MDPNLLEVDYLVIGAGAAAMAFVDTLLSESDATVLMVDRHAQPGGHWNDAYPFVRLHQPSACYGVNSRELGSGRKDASALGNGLYELASGTEILSYYEQVMNQQFLLSGRVRYYPMCDYIGDRASDHRFVSLLSGREYRVQVRRKLVDATHARTQVPSTHPPKYRVASGVACVPPNDLPRIGQPCPAYVVVGSGKTGIDTCVWLLQNGVAPESIYWIMPKDAWLVDRANIQPGLEYFEQVVQGVAAQYDAIADATSLPDLFGRLEQSGQLLRIDPAVTPTAYRGATVSQAELGALRGIRHKVRLGHVQAIEPGRIELERGTLDVPPGALHVDCSAKGLDGWDPVRVFDAERINLTLVSNNQPVFSAALIAYVECHLADDHEKNACCGPVPAPRLPEDWIRIWASYMNNFVRWRADPGLTQWLGKSRLFLMTTVMRDLRPEDTERHALLHKLANARQRGVENLPRLMAMLT
ncbi:NAD(P)/FAD-dependent oxidoreductase [Pseudomonas resinovorans]|uniref:NAD(P)/FAD-dependent oxidoreductase n=1 Tax=Metapseudomonas resinovorans TaxID=53412 RepID=UPI00237EFBEB|nr:NAD(P)/FAD-dependent oxidoreductase [Pseudomonas resinovorans]MDE3739053.1 NAD(P)/FAD-dependent oxidoreductase [Pseudomonas resinovorans]